MAFPGSDHVMQKAYSRFCDCQMRGFIKGQRCCWAAHNAALPGNDGGGFGGGTFPANSKLRAKQRADPGRQAHRQGTPKGHAHNRWPNGRTAGPGCQGAQQREKGQ